MLERKLKSLIDIVKDLIGHLQTQRRRPAPPADDPGEDSDHRRMRRRLNALLEGVDLDSD